METRRITLSSIDLSDTRYQVRDPRVGTWGNKVMQEQMSTQHVKALVRALVNEGVTFPAIKVIEEPFGSGRYIVADGFHRCGAYKAVNKKTKGKRFKQITVNVVDEEIAKKEMLTTNIEHNALPLQPAHRTELQWQQFLVLELEQPDISKKELSRATGAATSTIATWRKLKKQFEAAGYFTKATPVPKSISTGFPMLTPSRNELKRGADFGMQEENQGRPLTESDKQALETLLKVAFKADDKDKLLLYVKHYWGENPKLVNYDLAPTDINSMDDF